MVVAIVHALLTRRDSINSYESIETEILLKARWSPGRLSMLAAHGEEPGILKRGEKGQECIIGPVSADRGSRWCDPFQRPFLHCKICLDVDVCRLDAFVAKPKSDHGHVDSGL